LLAKGFVLGKAGGSALALAGTMDSSTGVEGFGEDEGIWMGFFMRFRAASLRYGRQGIR